MKPMALSLPGLPSSFLEAVGRRRPRHSHSYATLWKDLRGRVPVTVRTDCPSHGQRGRLYPPRKTTTEAVYRVAWGGCLTVVCSEQIFTMIISTGNRSVSPRSCQQAHGGRPRKRPGVVALELAVLAPFLAALTLGMFEMGRLVMVKQTLCNAARKGCRTGVTSGKGYQNLLDDVNNILTDNGFTTASATITVRVATYSGSSTVPSSVLYDHHHCISLFAECAGQGLGESFHPRQQCPVARPFVLVHHVRRFGNADHGETGVVVRTHGVFFSARFIRATAIEGAGSHEANL